MLVCVLTKLQRLPSAAPNQKFPSSLDEWFPLNATTGLRRLKSNSHVGTKYFSLYPNCQVAKLSLGIANYVPGSSRWFTIMYSPGSKNVKPNVFPVNLKKYSQTLRLLIVVFVSVFRVFTPWQMSSNRRVGGGLYYHGPCIALGGFPFSLSFPTVFSHCVSCICLYLASYLVGFRGYQEKTDTEVE